MTTGQEVGHRSLCKTDTTKELAVRHQTKLPIEGMHFNDTSGGCDLVSHFLELADHSMYAL